jgi:membrane-bound metal-dependent hydrolase YbcI (DUF457 family)
MPGYQKHLVLGTIVAGLALWIVHTYNLASTELSGFEWIILALVVFIYSQLPDIDANSSKINKLWNTTAGLGGLWLILTKTNIYLGVFCILSIIWLDWVRHRGFTHDVWFGVLLAAPLLFLGRIFAIVGFITYISHIIADGQFGR